MRKIILYFLICVSPILFSCEEDEEINIDLCEICESDCCDKVGTEDCCCSGI